MIMQLDSWVFHEKARSLRKKEGSPLEQEKN